MARKPDRPSPEGETIDRDSFEPAYVQLAGILRRQIAQGHFRPGDQLPSEAQLVRRYGVSPMTVRRSINLLADQDVVRTAQGRGTFVKPLKLGMATFHLQELQDLFSDEEATTVRLLEVRILPVNPRLARKLDLEPDDRAIFIRRLLMVDREPAFYHREYLVYDPSRPIVEAELEVTSLQGLFAGSGSNLLKRSRLTIEAVLLDEYETRLLETSYPAAGFYMEHLFYDFDDRPISWGWFVCPSGRLRFTTTLGIDEES